MFLNTVFLVRQGGPGSQAPSPQPQPEGENYARRYYPRARTVFYEHITPKTKMLFYARIEYRRKPSSMRARRVRVRACVCVFVGVVFCLTLLARVDSDGKSRARR